MKKGFYLTVGILAGAVFSTAIGASAEQIKSLVGMKVSAEYTVNVDGKQLADKAVIINNKAMVPLRSISETMGAEVKLENKNKSIEVKTEQEAMAVTDSTSAQNNSFSGQTKFALQNTLKSIDEYQMPPLKEARDRLINQIAQAKDEGNEAFVAEKQKQLDEYEDLISNLEAKRSQILQALDVAQK